MPHFNQIPRNINWVLICTKIHWRYLTRLGRTANKTELIEFEQPTHEIFPYLILAGFNEVFSIKTLSIFTPTELGCLLSGEDTIPVPWTFHELVAAFEPVAGYTRQSPSYKLLLEVLVAFTGLERRAFVKFVTGSPNLPPGGFRNLFPKLKVTFLPCINSPTNSRTQGYCLIFFLV